MSWIGRFRWGAYCAGAFVLAWAPQRSFGQATELEMANLILAIELAQLDTQYIHSIENLNDFVSASPPIHAFDDIHDGGGTWAIDPATGRFLPNRIDLRSGFFAWQGPYAIFQQNRISLDGGGYDPGTLLDLWGRPYYLFTPLGLARPETGQISLELYGDQFDRYAIVSLGPDGVKSADDAIRLFGAPPTRLAVSSLLPRIAGKGASATIRGYRFGANQGGGGVMVEKATEKANAAEAADAGSGEAEVEAWSDREIRFAMPDWAGNGLYWIRVRTAGGAVSDPPLQIEIATAARARWMLYE